MTTKPPTRPIPLRLTQAELEDLMQEAQRQYGAPHRWGQLLRKYGRDGLARDQGKVAETPSFETYKRLADEVSALRVDLSRVGGNLNQIAHAVNLHDVVDGRKLDDAHQELREQFNRLMAVVKEVSRGLLHR